MIFLLLTYLLISFLCTWAGILFYSLLARFGLADNGGPGAVIFYPLSGLLLITAVGEWLVLISPITNGIRLWLLALMLLITIFSRKTFSKSLKALRKDISFLKWPAILALCSFTIMILTLNAGPTIMDDTESYHIQMVKWIREFGSVPGIANLHLRFGFNSAWFTSIAMLSPDIPGINGYTALNGVLSVWLFYYLIQKIENKTNLPSVLAFLLLFILAFINWPLLRGNATTSNYDFISCFMILILFLEMIEHPDEPIPIEWLIWPLFLFSIRMINFPLTFLTLAFLPRIFKQRDFRPVLLGICAAFLLIVPFLFRNVILSGYPFFPSYFFDVFHLDWKADKGAMNEILRYIKYFNRVNPQGQSLLKTARLQFPEWIFAWYRYLFVFDKIIVTFSFLSYLLLLLLIRKILRVWQTFFFLLVMLFCLASWYLIAPDPRFVYGPLLIAPFLLIMQIPIKSTWSNRMKTFVMLLIFSWFGLYTLNKIKGSMDYRNALLPLPLPKPSEQTITLGKIRLHIPGKVLNNWNPRCYDIELPCIYKVDPRLEPRGEHISDGFRLNYGLIPDSTAIKGEFEIQD